MGRGESITRQWEILKTLQQHRVGVSLRELADRVGYGARTIQRDIRVLRNVGFPIEHTDDEFGKRFWRMPSGFIEREGLLLSMTEALSLYFARQLLAPFQGALLAEGFDSVIDKIIAQLPASALRHFRELQGAVLVRSAGATDYRKHRKTVEALSEAIRSARVVELTYRAVWRGERYTTAVHPYGLVYFEGELYLVGYSERALAIRVFKITRVIEVATTPVRFRRPRDFSLEAHFHGSFGIVQPGATTDVVVEFDPPIAPLIEERVWHPSQKLRAGRDGRLVATYRLGGTVEFVRWIMGFGPQAHVVAPASLRQHLRDTLRAAADRYATDGEPPAAR